MLIHEIVLRHYILQIWQVKISSCISVYLCLDVQKPVIEIAMLLWTSVYDAASALAEMSFL